MSAKGVYVGNTSRKKKDEEILERTKSTEDGTAKGVRVYGDVRVSSENTRDRKVFKNYAKEAGAKTPALGVSAQNRTSIPARNRSGFSQFSQFSSAKDFTDYARMRREAEEAEGMQSAAEKLLNNQKSYSEFREEMEPYEKHFNNLKRREKTFSFLRNILGTETQEEQEEKVPAGDIATVQTPQEYAAEQLMRNYGYKTIGNGSDAVFVTPFSPLPPKTAENTASRTKTPGLFDIKPEEYLENMGAIDNWNNRVPEAADPDAKAFLDKYFGGRIPTDDEFNTKYDEIYNDPSISDEDVRYFFWEGAELVGKEMGRLSLEPEARVGYNAAMEMLGPDAAKYAGKTDAEYLSRYAVPIYGKEPVSTALTPFPQLEEGENQMNEKEFTNWLSRYGTGEEMNDFTLWQAATQKEKDTYAALSHYRGEEEALKYFEALKPEISKRITEQEVLKAEAYAQEHPVLASMGVPFQRMGGTFGFAAETIKELMTGDAAGEYDLSRLGTRKADTIVGTVGEKIKQDVGGFWGEALGFSYQTAMSLADMGANMLVFGPAGAVATSGAMGLSAGASAYNGAIDRGADHQTANAVAAVSAIAEMLFEKFSLDNLIGIAEGNGLGKAVLNVMRQMGIEASEEMATEIANQIGDYVLMGDMSMLAQEGPAEVAKQIGLAGLGGTMMGGVTGGIAQGVNSWRNRGTQQQTESAQEEVQKEQSQAPAENVQQPEEQNVQPEEDVPDVRDALIREYTPTDAQETQNEAETAMDEQEEAQKEKPAEGAYTSKNGEAFSAARSARVTDEEGNTSAVTVLGVKSVSDSGLITLEVENENGERDTINAADAEFDDDNTNELMAYAASGRMDAKAMRGYLDGYDENIATAEEYAEAYTSVYSRARGGVDFEQAALGNAQARQYLSRDAMIDAYAAGQNAYNQVHDTGSAEIVSEKGGESAADASYSIKEEGGRRFVEIDTDQELFEGLNGNQMLKAAEKYILDHFKGRIIGDKENEAYVSRRTAKEYSHPANRRLREEVRQAKGKASTELDNMLKASKYIGHEADDGGHPEATGGWDYYETVFRVNGIEFTGKINVLNGDGFRTLHDITEIKENTGRDLGSPKTSSVQTTQNGANGAKAKVASEGKPQSGLPADTPEAESATSNKSIAGNRKKGKGKISKRYTGKAFEALGSEGKKKALAQMELLSALATRTGRTIAIVDEIVNDKGEHANALYDRKTGEIRVALDADENAYAYAAVHELVHAMKNEHSSQWKEFRDFVFEALRESGSDVEKLIAYQMERFGYSRELAEEEVVCNTVPAILGDERNVLKLYKGSRKLFDRVVDWVKDLLGDIRKAGEVLSQRSRSWAQMDALKNDREKMQKIYDIMMQIMAEEGEAAEGTRDISYSMKDSEGNELTEEQQEYFAESKVRDDEGKLLVMYRGGGEEINVFDRKKSKYTNLYGRGFYFTDSETHAKQYGEARRYYLRINNPLSAESGEKNITQKQMRAFIEAVAEDEDYGLENYGYGATVDSVLRSLRGKNDFDALQDINATAIGDFVAAIELFNEVNGTEYDGIIVPTETVAFNSNQIKSIDNKTPTDNADIRYSMRDTDENVQSALAAEESAIAQVKAHRINAMEADKIAGQMLKLANSDYDRQELASRISRVISYMETAEDVDMQQVDDEMTAITADVMNHSRTLDLEHEERMKPIRDYLRTTKIRLTDKQRAEAANLSGSYGAFRKSMVGRARLVSVGGIALDTAWQELNAIDRGLFPGNVREGDMPVLLQAAIDEAKPVYHNGMGMNADESANWLAGKMMEAYFALPAVKAAAKDAKKFGDSMRKLKKAMSQFEDVSWSEYQNALQSIKQARTNEERTQKQQEAAALRKKYQQWRAKDTAERKERELKNRYRAKIERTTMTLSNWLLKPTDAKHVPAGLEDSIRRMLETLDFSGKDTKTAAMLSERLASLASAMENAQEGADETRTVFLERDQQMIDEIRRVAELIRGNTSYQQMEGRGIYDLNSKELKELSKWLDVIRHNVVEASKLRGSDLPYASVDEAAALSMMEMGRKKAWKDKKWITKTWMKAFGPDMQDSFTFFERLGPTANQIFRGLREGFDKVTRLTRQAEMHTKEILKDVNLKELTGRSAKKISFELASGEKIELTKAQIMEIYVLEKREKARGHLYGDGIVLEGDDDRRAKQLKHTDVKRIVSALSAEEKKVADGLQSFVSRECASWGNEASVKLVGYRKFGEQYYWPIRTDSNTRNTTKLDDSYAADINAIRNQGMTKQTVEGAKNAIVIGDIFDTYTRHISNMAAYAGYALPLSDFTRWYNSRGVKTEIEQMMGRKGLNYINNFLMAVNGSGLREEQSGIAKAAGVLSRNAKIASVGANVRVVVQQPTSYARAAMYMSPKYLSMGLAMKAPDADLVNRYCGIAQWKRWGFYETNIGPNLRQMIVGDETVGGKMREAAMKPAALGDNWTLNHLWNACVAETKAEYGYKEGSEAFYTQVGKRLSEIIDRTQVVDSVFHRSQMMRSKNAMNQMMTNFMSEPTKTYNMLMSAISDYADNRKNKAARNRVVRGLVVYAATGILTAAAAAIVDAIRDDDADKEWAEKYLDALGSNAIDNLRPSGLLPGVKDVISLLEGYEPSRLDQQSIQRIIWAVDEVKKYAEGTSKQNLYGVTYKIMQAVSSLVGIPVSNLMRDGNAIAQTITGVTPTLTAEARGNQTISHLFNALMKGEKERGKKLREELRIKAGMTPKEIDTELAEKLMGDELIKTAWEAKTAKNYGDMNRAKNALTAKGFNSETVDKAITRYGSSVTPKTPKVKDPAEQLMVTLYSEEEVVSAARILAGVESGGSVTEADVRSMISERIAGSEAKNPDDSVKSGIQSALKKDYLAMEAKGDVAGMNKLGMVMKNLLGTEDEDMEQWVKDQHSANLRTAVDSYDSAAAAKAVQAMRKDGKTDSQIKSSLQKYKQLYIDAMNRKDTITANKIKRLLIGLGLKGKNGDPFYDEETFIEWMKK